MQNPQTPKALQSGEQPDEPISVLQGQSRLSTADLGPDGDNGPCGVCGPDHSPQLQLTEGDG